MAVLKTVLFCSVFIFLGYVETVCGDYSKDVNDVFESLPSHLSGSSSCVKAANSSFKGSDKKWAEAIIHLYTMECPYPTAFYKVLNGEMRSHTATGVWKNAGDLINQGLDILGMEVHRLVYRGCIELPTPVKGNTNFRFDQITSTSLNISVAVRFCSGTLFKIENVYGVAVEDFSDFGDEHEVLVKSYNAYKVTDVITDSDEISKAIGTQNNPISLLVYLDGQPDVNTASTAYLKMYLVMSIVIQIIAILS